MTINRLPKAIVLLVAMFGGFVVPFAQANSDATTVASATWTQLSPANAPGPLSEAAMAYDPVTKDLVLFGGDSSNGLVNQTWLWDGSNWSEVPSSPSDPPALDEASMAYDSATKDVILIGGSGTTGVNAGMWGWNGATWAELTPATLPPDRVGASMAYDAATGNVVLFGGYGNSNHFYNDTWTWNGTTWSEVSPPTSPPARVYAAMDYDATTGNLVLFGGNGLSGNLNDTWTWNGTTWTEMSPPTSPSNRSNPNLVYDATSGLMLLYGGYGGAYETDTWTWNGTTWTQLSPAASPSFSAGNSMTFDPKTGDVMLFGGFNGTNYLAQTWTWGILQSPSITSAPSTTFAAGSSGTYTITSTGTPSADLRESGALPAGITFLNNGDGTASITGSAGSSGTYPITVTADNAVSPVATQDFTLTVSGPSVPPTTTSIPTAPTSTANPGSISGVVTSSEGGVAQPNVCVTAFSSASTATYSATTNSSGDYTISSLPAGYYVVEFDPTCNQTTSSNLQIEYYEVADELSEANVITVGTGNISGINGILFPASTLSGTITNGSSAPVANVCVDLFSSDGYLFPAQGLTNASGQYSIGGLPDGTYNVLFDPSCDLTQSSPYAFQYYNDEPDYGVANTVSWETPSTRTLNAALAIGASIAGTVTAPDARTPAGICVYAVAADGQAQEIYILGSAGTYDFTNLPAESYTLEFDPTCGSTRASDFAVGWYGGGANFSGATTFPLSAGQNVSIDDTLGLSKSALSLATASLPNATESAAYSATVQAAGGTAPYEYLASGLPSGLSMDPSTGSITGTPTASGDFTVAVSVIDASTPAVVSTTALSLSVAVPSVAIASVPAAGSIATTTTDPARTESACSPKTKTVTVLVAEVKDGKKVTVGKKETERVFRTVTVKKIEKIKGKKATVITHRKELVEVCRTIVVG
jgi:hypothetical protein